jgi:hypothetical protein
LIERNTGKNSLICFFKMQFFDIRKFDSQKCETDATVLSEKYWTTMANF